MVTVNKMHTEVEKYLLSKMDFQEYIKFSIPKSKGCTIKYVDGKDKTIFLFTKYMFYSHCKLWCYLSINIII